MRKLLDLLDLFETEPLEDCKRAHVWVKRILADRSVEAQRTRDRKNGWRERNPRKPDDAQAIESRRRKRRETSIAARAERLLATAGRAMRTRELADALNEDGGELKEINTIRSGLAREIRRGENARIVKLDRGVYALRGWGDPAQAGVDQSGGTDRAVIDSGKQ